MIVSLLIAEFLYCSLPFQHSFCNLHINPVSQYHMYDVHSIILWAIYICSCSPQILFKMKTFRCFSNELCISFSYRFGNCIRKYGGITNLNNYTLYYSHSRNVMGDRRKNSCFRNIPQDTL